MKRRVSAETVATKMSKIVADHSIGDRKAAVEKTVKALKPGDPVPVSAWGKDHWSTFAYLESRTVDFKGVLDFRHMRGQRGVACKYPTFLALGVELPGHSDWDCLDDIEEAGLVSNLGSGINPLIQMTEKGYLVAAALRAHKAAGGSFSNFELRA